ncbi:M20 family metallopeptidase [Brachybacterium sacelli]|uniref:Succinyl-diaminopimelate desuccinylase n=1 Tax=Brachybacterium sacelli TaxID=173364 RepID=A0ABS4WYU0_9MICO|nr:M20/M25/M40 family metallo-hydrolase [Brachybacterium sacelli]MBP2381370.1 succinyl-diaminopimelate desuccinylase [Brachybacterium sacelli]
MIDPLTLASDLIRIPSPSADGDGMRAVQRHVAEVVREHVPDARIRTGGEERPWTLLTVGPGGPAPLFACHTDTVPVGDAQRWSRDPLGGDQEEGLLHGRGSVDMKGGLAAAAAALVRAATEGASGHLLLTADEEIGSLGAQRTGGILAELDLSGIIIPEATGLSVRCSHRGACWLRLISRGRAAHGSAPERGVNAVLRLAGALGPAAASVPLRRDEVLGAETASIGTFDGGDATNIVPATAVATLDQRTIADSAPLLAHWRAVDGIDEVETILDLAALRTDPDHPFVRELPALADPSPVTYFTDGSVMQGFRPDVPVVVWGPGDPTQMHSVDEHLEIDQLTEAADLFAQVLLSGR